jgi:mannose-6-phosphate isomerase-like protein (cupin superfamily)
MILGTLFRGDMTKREFRRDVTKKQRRDEMDAEGTTKSGLVTFQHAYSFAEGGPVEEGRVPGEPDRLLPFEVARWHIEPGTSNDLDVHRSHEMWLLMEGEGELTLDQQHLRISSGDAVMMDSQAPHRVRNIGRQPLHVFSVYWPPEGRGNQRLGA